MECAKRMRDDGTLPSGREIKSPPKLFIGGADTPMDPADERWKPDGLLAKIDAGAGFFQTQFCFDADLVRTFDNGPASLAARLRDLVQGEVEQHSSEIR